MQANGGMHKSSIVNVLKIHLSVGNSVDLNKAFKDFIGHDMQIEPYLRNAGLLEK
jgi:peptidyl-dipeptidase Dcp